MAHGMAAVPHPCEDEPLGPHDFAIFATHYRTVAAVDRERGGQELVELSRQRLGRELVGIRLRQRELVAAETRRDVVLADRALDPASGARSSPFTGNLTPPVGVLKQTSEASTMGGE